MAKKEQLTLKHIKDIEKQLAELHKATEKYLHAALEVAKLKGSKHVKAIKPHIINAGKHLDTLHTHRKKIKKLKKKKKRK